MRLLAEAEGLREVVHELTVRTYKGLLALEEMPDLAARVAPALDIVGQLLEEQNDARRDVARLEEMAKGVS